MRITVLPKNVEILVENDEGLTWNTKAMVKNPPAGGQEVSAYRQGYADGYHEACKMAYTKIWTG